MTFISRDHQKAHFISTSQLILESKLCKEQTNSIKKKHPKTHIFEAVRRRNGSEKSNPLKGASMTFTESTYKMSTTQLNLNLEGARGGRTAFFKVTKRKTLHIFSLNGLLNNFGLSIDWFETNLFQPFKAPSSKFKHK